MDADSDSGENQPVINFIQKPLEEVADEGGVWVGLPHFVPPSVPFSGGSGQETYETTKQKTKLQETSTQVALHYPRNERVLGV